MRAALALLRVTPGRRQREQPRADDSGRALGPAGYILTSDRLIENSPAQRPDPARGHHGPALPREELP
jgi:hypothetical protein